jgi:hypothetical protein
LSTALRCAGGLRPVTAHQNLARGLRPVDVGLFTADLRQRLLGGRVDGFKRGIIGGGAIFAVNK